MKVIYAVIPMGVPAMGKTTAFSQITQTLKAQKLTYSIVSSDESRKQVCDELSNSHPHLSEDDIWAKSGKASN
jgi:signal recognition particle GTPase